MNSSTRSSGKPNGGAPRGGSGSTTSRKSPTKKFGKNLNKLTSQKLSAPPVPVLVYLWDPTGSPRVPHGTPRSSLGDPRRSQEDPSGTPHGSDRSFGDPYVQFE